MSEAEKCNKDLAALGDVQSDLDDMTAMNMKLRAQLDALESELAEVKADKTQLEGQFGVLNETHHAFKSAHFREQAIHANVSFALEKVRANLSAMAGNYMNSKDEVQELQNSLAALEATASANEQDAEARLNDAKEQYESTIDYKLQMAELVHKEHTKRTEKLSARVRNECDVAQACIDKATANLNSLSKAADIDSARTEQLTKAGATLGKFMTMLPGEERLQIDVGDEVMTGERNLEEASQTHQTNVNERLQQTSRTELKLSNCTSDLTTGKGKLATLEALSQRNTHRTKELVDAREKYADLVMCAVHEEEQPMDKQLSPMFSREKPGFDDLEAESESAAEESDSEGSESESAGTETVFRDMDEVGAGGNNE